MAASSSNETPETDWVVFISHSGVDTWVAQQISREVGLSGARCFLDEADIAVGEDFEERILAAIWRSNELLVLLTPWALTRPYVWLEIGAAWARRIPIVGILYGITPSEIQSNSGVPVLLKSRDLIDINEIGTYFDQLKQRVETISRDR